MSTIHELYTARLTDLEGPEGRWQLAYDHIAENTMHMSEEELIEDAIEVLGEEGYQEMMQKTA